MGSTLGPPDNRTFLLTPSNVTVTQMDTAVFVCVPANISLQATWSDHDSSVTRTNNFSLTIRNVMENATILCTIDSETASASLTVQGKLLMILLIIVTLFVLCVRE